MQIELGLGGFPLGGVVAPSFHTWVKDDYGVRRIMAHRPPAGPAYFEVSGSNPSNDIVIRVYVSNE